MRALVLDDDAVHQRLLFDVLNELGLVPCLSTSIQDARAHLRDHEHVLVIAELILGGRLVAVSDLLRDSAISVIALSRYSTVDELTAGAAGVLTKPYEIDQLIELIERIICVEPRP